MRHKGYHKQNNIWKWNIKIINDESHSLTTKFNDIMYSGGFSSLISRPSWIIHTSPTLIDNVYSNQTIDRYHSRNGIT